MIFIGVQFWVMMGACRASTMKCSELSLYLTNYKTQKQQWTLREGGSPYQIDLWHSLPPSPQKMLLSFHLEAILLFEMICTLFFSNFGCKYSYCFFFPIMTFCCGCLQTLIRPGNPTFVVRSMLQINSQIHSERDTHRLSTDYMCNQSETEKLKSTFSSLIISLVHHHTVDNFKHVPEYFLKMCPHQQIADRSSCHVTVNFPSWLLLLVKFANFNSFTQHNKCK